MEIRIKALEKHLAWMGLSVRRMEQCILCGIMGMSFGGFYALIDGLFAIKMFIGFCGVFFIMALGFKIYDAFIEPIEKQFTGVPMPKKTILGLYDNVVEAGACDHNLEVMFKT